MNHTNCNTCVHKQNPQGGHCYMFREEPEFDCQIHQPVNVETIGHIDHSKATITRSVLFNALLKSVKVKD